MQKLLDRMGTQQHKYRLALHFTSLYVGGQAYLPPGVLHRIVLQRGSKKYTSNYLTVKAACDNPISETIQVKATMFFDASRQKYQQKKFDILILRKDVYAETTVAKFAFLAENHLGFHGEQVMYQDSLNRLVCNIYCSSMDAEAHGGDNNSVSSISARSSIDRSAERRKSQTRDSMPMVPHMLVAGGVSSPSSRIGYAHHQQYVTQPHQQQLPPQQNSQIRRSIVQQVRFDYDKEVLRGSQQRNQMAYYNNPYPSGPPHHHSEHEVRLPPQSPPKMQSQLHIQQNPQLNQAAAYLLLQAANRAPPQPRAPVQQDSRMRFQQPQANPFSQLTAQLAEKAIQQPSYQQEAAKALQYPTQPPLQTLRQNFRIQVSNPEQTQYELQHKKSSAVPEAPQLDIGLVTNIPMLPSPSMKTSKPARLEQSKKPQSPTLTFKDLINVDNEKLPVQKRSASKKESLVLTPAPELVLKSKERAQLPSEAIIVPPLAAKPPAFEGPDITAVDSQYIEPVKQMVVMQEAPPPVELPPITTISLQQAKQSYMTASFKSPTVSDDRLLNASFESPKFVVEDHEFDKRQQILKEQLERERQSYRQDLNMRRKLQQEKDLAYDSEIRTLNQRLAAEAQRYQQEIAMREQFIAEKEGELDKVKMLRMDRSSTAHSEKQVLVAELDSLRKVNGQLTAASQQQELTISSLNLQVRDLQTNNAVLCSQQSILKSQFDQLSMEHQRALSQHQQMQREYNRLAESHADLNDHKLSIDQINTGVKQRLDYTLLELERLSQAKLELQSENGTLANELRVQRQQSEDLLAVNKQLSSEINRLKVELEQSSSQLQQTNNIGREYERLSIFNRNSIGEMEQLRADNELLAKKQQDVLDKYIRNFNDLNAERLEREKAEQEIKVLGGRILELSNELRARDQEIGDLHGRIKSMEYTMVVREEDPAYISLHQQHTAGQRQLQQLQNQLATKQSHIDLLNDKLIKTQQLLTDTIAIYTAKEQTLSEALSVKDRRVAELEKQSDRVSTRSQITVKYAHADQEKRQLLLKIESLNSQVERLGDVEDELAVCQAINKDLQLRVKQLTAEMSTIPTKQQPVYRDRRSTAGVEQLQAELARTNTKLAQMLQLVFRRNPSLAQELARIKV